MSYLQAEAAFRDWAAECGFPNLPDVLTDGRIHRFHVDGDKRGSRNGYCRFQAFADGGAAGTVGSWKTGEQHQWHRHGGRVRRPSTLEAMRRDDERAERQRQQAAEHVEALMRMQTEWHRAPSASDSHPYCKRKSISARPYNSPALRLGNHGELLVPAFGFDDDWQGAPRSLQRIFPDGSKRNATGCPLTGLVYPFGRRSDEYTEPLVLAEGWATAATVYQALGFDAAQPWPVLCCFGAGNLLGVAREAHARWPECPILIAADDDEAGSKAALEAAREVGGWIATPHFPDECERTAKDTDFNDLARLSPDGVEAVLRCIEDAREVFDFQESAA